MRRYWQRFLLMLIVSLFLGLPAFGQWSQDPASGTVITTSTGYDLSYAPLVEDGAGGAIVAWMEPAQGKVQILSQHLNSFGVAQWTETGISVGLSARYSKLLPIITDGSGGAIISWTELEADETIVVTAQRIDADGHLRWDDNGVTVGVGQRTTRSFSVVSDGSGGAVFVWFDEFAGIGYRQRLNGNGQLLWGDPAPGMALNAFDYDSVVADGLGGVIVTYLDMYLHLNGQRFDSNGMERWGNLGVLLNGGDSGASQIVADETGGAIIVFAADRNDGVPAKQILAQKISADGAPAWASGGVALSKSQNHQYFPAATTDGHGGAIVGYNEYMVPPPPNGGTIPIPIAQRISSRGVLLWGPMGKAINRDGREQSLIGCLSDDAGGAIFFSDYTGFIAQRLNSRGISQWQRRMGTSFGTTRGAMSAASNGFHGTIFTWSPSSYGDDVPIIANEINSNGVLGGGP